MYPCCIVAAFALLFISPSFATISVVTPVSTTTGCAVQLSWQGGTAPWVLSILSSASPNPKIEVLGSSAGSPFTWTVDVGAGTNAILSVQDSTGDVGQSSPFTVAKAGLGNPCGGGGDVGGGSGSTTVPISGHLVGSGTSNSSPAPTTSASGASQPTQGGSKGTGDSSGGSQQADPNSSSDTDQNSSSIEPTLPTSSSNTDTTSSTHTPADFHFHSDSNSASESSSSTLSTNSQSSPPTFTLPDPTTGPGPIEPAASVVESGVSSTAAAGNGIDDGSNNVDLSKKSVMSGPILGGIIAAAVCALLVAFCVLRRCRRRRRNAVDRLAYPFGPVDAEAVPREMVGRTGYPASTFSSWGNHGDLDDRTVSPTVVSTEAHPQWEAAPGTIESRYQAAFAPGHASSSSIDRNDPTSHQRFRSRAPIPKAMMTDARHAEPLPSEAPPIFVSEQLVPYAPDVKSRDGPSSMATTPNFDEMRPQAMPSWGTMHVMMAGRQPVAPGYPPSYTSR